MAEYALISSEPAEAYEAWMVKNLEILKEYKPQSIAIVALPGADRDETCVLTGYYNANFGDKHRMAGAIQDDITEQLIRANIDQYLDELENEENEED